MIESVNEISINNVSEKNIFDFIKGNALTIGEVKVVKDLNGLLLSILSGDTVILCILCVASFISGTFLRGTKKASPVDSSVLQGDIALK